MEKNNKKDISENYSLNAFFTELRLSYFGDGDTSTMTKKNIGEFFNYLVSEQAVLVFHAILAYMLSVPSPKPEVTNVIIKRIRGKTKTIITFSGGSIRKPDLLSDLIGSINSDRHEITFDQEVNDDVIIECKSKHINVISIQSNLEKEGS